MNCAMPAAISRASPAWRITTVSSVASTRSRWLTRAASTRSRAEPHRAALQQRLGGDAQDGLEEIDRRVAPKRAVEPLAEPDPGRRGVVHGGGDKVGAAKLEKAAMADTMPRRPIEDLDGVGLGDPFAQDLSRLVPVDQKDEASAERLEEGVAGFVVGGRVAASDEIEIAFVAERRGIAVLEPAPLDGKIANESGEEFCPRQMYVGVDHRHGIRLDVDHHNMSVGFADVVLQRQARALHVPPSSPGRDD